MIAQTRQWLSAYWETRGFCAYLCTFIEKRTVKKQALSPKKIKECACTAKSQHFNTRLYSLPVRRCATQYYHRKAKPTDTEEASLFCFSVVLKLYAWLSGVVSVYLFYSLFAALSSIDRWNALNDSPNASMAQWALAIQKLLPIFVYVYWERTDKRGTRAPVYNVVTQTLVPLRTVYAGVHAPILIYMHRQIGDRLACYRAINRKMSSIPTVTSFFFVFHRSSTKEAGKTKCREKPLGQQRAYCQIGREYHRGRE